MTDSERKAAWYQANREKVRARQKENYEKNKVAIRQKQDEYVAKNKDAVRKYQATYREDHKDAHRTYFKERYGEKKPEIIKQQGMPQGAGTFS